LLKPAAPKNGNQDGEYQDSEDGQKAPVDDAIKEGVDDCRGHDDG
jgi:hypothetical protein